MTSDEAGRRAEATIREVYATPLNSGIPAISMDLETAELVKVSANSFLATKISFINAMAEMCEAAGGDVIALANAIGIDERIGRRFLSPGLGFGGGCLPKDIRAFRSTAASKGVESIVSLLTTVDEINLGRRERVITLAREAVGGSLTGKRIAVLGIAFKPNTDDLRDSPSLDVCKRLAAEGAVVSVHDPVAMANAALNHPEFHYADSVHDAAEQAEVVLHLTEWADYRAIDPVDLASVVAQKMPRRCPFRARRRHLARRRVDRLPPGPADEARIAALRHRAIIVSHRADSGRPLSARWESGSGNCTRLAGCRCRWRGGVRLPGTTTAP